MVSDRDRPGRFNDGRSAASRTVVVRVTATGLEIFGIDGFKVAVWRTEDLLPDGEMPDGKGVRLRCAAEPDARLTVEDAVFIRRDLPKTVLTRPGVRALNLRLLASMLAGVVVLIGLYVSIPVLARWAVPLVSVEMERDWGRQIAAGLEANARVCRNPSGLNAVKALTDRLAAHLPPGRQAVNVHVLDEKMVNALALPGGEIIVFRGLIDVMEGPDELAGVLAHELTHIGERHVTAALIRGVGVGVLATLVTGDASGLVASGVTALMAATYTRDDEEAADRGAVRLLRQARIDNAGLATFFLRLERLEAGGLGLPAWMGTHPEAKARAARISAEAEPSTLAPALRGKQWQAVKDICRPLSSAPSIPM